jgi:hypothetical protein
MTRCSRFSRTQSFMDALRFRCIAFSSLPHHSQIWPGGRRIGPFQALMHFGMGTWNLASKVIAPF